MITLLLTCVNQTEAKKITQSLLSKRLVVCVRQVEVNSEFLFNGQQEESDEVQLIMESDDDKFDAIESEVALLHSYDTFVLTAYRVDRVSKTAKEWLQNELQ